jgi:hypothetical protein
MLPIDPEKQTDGPQYRTVASIGYITEDPLHVRGGLSPAKGDVVARDSTS